MSKGKKKSRIKSPEKNTKTSFGIKTPVEPENFDLKFPVFSLERLQGGDFCFSCLQTDHKAAFADAIFKRKSCTWAGLKQMDRHALGFEKIPLDQIKTGIPDSIKEDRDYFLSFRYSGKHPMVGYRIKDIFYILWFDHNMTLYDHG